MRHQGSSTCCSRNAPTWEAHQSPRMLAPRHRRWPERCAPRWSTPFAPLPGSPRSLHLQARPSLPSRSTPAPWSAIVVSTPRRSCANTWRRSQPLHHKAPGARPACVTARHGFICACVSCVAMSAAATHRRNNMRPGTSAPQVTRSCSRWPPARPGAGAIWTSTSYDYAYASLVLLGKQVAGGLVQPEVVCRNVGRILAIVIVGVAASVRAEPRKTVHVRRHQHAGVGGGNGCENRSRSVISELFKILSASFLGFFPIADDGSSAVALRRPHYDPGREGPPSTWHHTGRAKHRRGPGRDRATRYRLFHLQPCHRQVLLRFPAGGPGACHRTNAWRDAPRIGRHLAAPPGLLGARPQGCGPRNAALPSSAATRRRRGGDLRAGQSASLPQRASAA